LPQWPDFRKDRANEKGGSRNYRLDFCLVIRGLDPRIHHASQKSLEVGDCRIKPGNDG
jgi:hypothetical protein